MAIDLFEFWSQVQPADKQHPQDREVLSRIKGSFDLTCLPSCFMGPLKTAPVVLLYLSPGLSECDRNDAIKPKGRDRVMGCRVGDKMLPGPDDHETAWVWWKQRTKNFGEWRDLRLKVAFLNICAYHSTAFKEYWPLTALPSSRVTLDWAQTVLFPDAISGKRVVVCLRAAKFWGLDEGDRGKRYGKALFAPCVTRGGHMKSEPLKVEIIKTVKAALVQQ